MSVLSHLAQLTGNKEARGWMDMDGKHTTSHSIPKPGVKLNPPPFHTFLCKYGSSNILNIMFPKVIFELWHG
jgi:hypothetical protein